ncbi:MAG TPA: TonB-dependent receptor, partial [Elusimicrobiota bacterium]|nr:TonB-dependent receptor [Elusimicrobiota bacterium]
MRKTQRLTAVFGLCFGIIGNAMGAGYEMQPIIITASRVGENPGDMTRKVDVITHNDLETSAARDLSDVLTKLTSVNISHYGGVAGTKNVRMRGGTAQQVLVMVDGRPINNPRDGSVDLNTVPLDNVDRIEVLHGPASSLYGSQAMGGAVNVITKTPLPGKPVTEISTRYGSFSNSLHRLSHGAQISRFGYQINGELAGTRGFREHGGYKSQDLNGKWTYDLAARHKISLNLGANGDRADLPGEITAVDLDDEQRSVKNFADLAWNAELNDRIGVSARVYDNFDRLEFRENTAGALWDTAYEKTVHRTWVQGIDGNLRSRPFDADTVMVGVTFQRNKNESMRTGTHDYSVRAGYLENHLELFDRLKLSGSVRVDDYSTFGSKTNPSAGFLFKFTPRYRFRGLYSRSFRAPTFNDLYWPDTGWTKGNPNVRPEKGATKEVGIDNDLTDDLSVSATYFRNDFKDLINWAPDGAVWTPSNVDAAEMDG